MYSKINSAVLHGIYGMKIEIEVSLSKGLPAYQIVGLPDKTIRESKERVRNAIEALGVRFPPKRVTLNLIPAEVPKDGSHLDLPMAMGILAALGEVEQDLLRDIAFFGEMTLDGRLMPVPGILSMVSALKKQGVTNIVVPKEMEYEASLEEGISCYGAHSFEEVVQCFKSGEAKRAFKSMPSNEAVEERQGRIDVDFESVMGQEGAKRAFLIAASGFHNLILSGPPGSGKSMMMNAFKNILPPMNRSEAVEVRRIQSIGGNSTGHQLSLKRPFRRPHHQITVTAMTGGGSKVRPGEMTLSHRGVLFLDELPEFKREIIESMRQPLEDKVVRISRLHNKVCMPANFLLAATMNPCKCGFLHSLDKTCSCSDREIKTYLGRLSGPMLDRIDLLVEVQRVEGETGQKKGLSTGEMHAIVKLAAKRQKMRFSAESISFNSEMSAGQIEKYCPLKEDVKQLLIASSKSFRFSKRVQNKIIKISRTIADMEGFENIELHHIAEAIQYRLAETRLRGEEIC